MPVHFLDLAAAVEKLRWAEKEWRELDQELVGDDKRDEPSATATAEDETEEELDPDDAGAVLQGAR